jgi:ornithine carbamoyltransferase
MKKIRHFISIASVLKEEFHYILNLSQKIKHNPEEYRDTMKGKTLIMHFEKPSTRTRLSFEVGLTQMGGHAVFFSGGHIESKKEDLRDTATMLSRFGDLILARTFDQETIEELAQYSSVPVINGLSDERHPCQALADIFTILEKKGQKDVIAAWIGDGSNVCRSVILACAYAGIVLKVASPEGFEPDDKTLKQSRNMGGQVTVFRDPKDAVKDADVILTDVWSGMGDEAQREMKDRIFPPYQVNEELMSRAKRDAIFMHCLPANKGQEVSEKVLYGPQSVVYDEAENRLYSQKALILFLMWGFKNDI